ncbi:MAG: HAD-IA family hydrolase [Bacilli bacterium]|jgi:beta-phosphoglucomutase-like phosphatase (HAD superfamily)
MTKGIILDFDQTIVDSSKIEYLRDLRAWSTINQNYHLITLQPGIYAFFDFLYHHQIKIAVVSNAPRKKYLEGLIKHFKLKIDVVIGFEDVSKRKPSSEPMIIALQLLQLKNTEVISIGDQVNDIKASNSAQIQAIYYGDYIDESVLFSSKNFNEIIKYIHTKG